MFRFWIPLAHGAFGIFDELLAVTALVIFIAMLVAPPVITWLRRELDGAGTSSPERSNPAVPEDASKTDDDHYRLD
jgi:hypothetical protein